MDSLNDPQTGKCCPKRCNNELNKVNGSINSLLLQITRILSDKSQEAESKTNEVMQKATESIKEQTSKVESKLQELYRSIQSQILIAYQSVVNRLESVLPSQSESKSSTIPASTGQQAVEKPSPVPESSESEQPEPETLEAGSMAKRTAQLARQETPTYPQPSTGRPQETPKKKPEECFDIDFCEPVYAFLAQWQEQNIKVQQQTQEAYRQCCDNLNPYKKPDKDEIPHLVVPMSKFYGDASGEAEE